MINQSGLITTRSAPLTNLVTAYYGGGGWNGDITATGVGGLAVKTAQNWTNTANGTSLELRTTRIGQTLDTARIYINHYGQAGFNVAAPTAAVHLRAGTSAPSGSPLKFNVGAKQQTVNEVGAVNYDGGNLTLGDGTLTYDLVKALQFSTTFDFPSTATGVCNDLTIAQTGVTDRDGIVVGVPVASMPTTGSFSGYVSAAGVVSVRFCNNGLSSVDPASGSFKITVVKQ
jgi:hypothetical protein